MLPLVVGAKKTEIHILIYIFLLFFLTFLPVYQGDLGPIYATVAFLLGFIFLFLGIKLKVSHDPKCGLYIFFFSIVYLFLLFAAMLLDRFFTA